MFIKNMTSKVIGLIIISFGSLVYASEFDGIWHITANSNFFVIDGKNVTIFEQSNTGCVKGNVLELDTSNHLTYAGQAFGSTLKLENSKTFLLSDPSGYTLSATKVDVMPSICKKAIKNTPENNFEVLWHTFNEHYPFFHLYGVDWQAAYDKYRPLVNSEMRDDELAEIFIAMLASLQDGHVSIKGTLNGEEIEYKPKAQSQWFLAANDLIKLIKSDYITEPKRYADRTLAYAVLKQNKNIAYVNIVGMMGHSYDYFKHLELVNKGMQTIIKNASDPSVKALVIDLRFNGGGFDGIALNYARYFLNKPLKAYKRSTWYKNRFIGEQEINVSPHANLISDKQVYVLVSDYTASASEMFLFVMRQLPHVTIVGEKSAGDLSTVLNKKLPNGWEIGFSKERYLSISDEAFESRGIPPHHSIQIKEEDINTGKDVMLDWILGQVR